MIILYYKNPIVEILLNIVNISIAQRVHEKGGKYDILPNQRGGQLFLGLKKGKEDLKLKWPKNYSLFVFPGKKTKPSGGKGVW